MLLTWSIGQNFHISHKLSGQGCNILPDLSTALK
jgi:hypothetical protein